MFSRTLSHHAQNALALLGKSEIFKTVYLVGGSALALQLGHRRSIDFDFFSERKFEPKEVKIELEKLGTYREDQQTPKTMLGLFNKIKFSLFHYPYSLITSTKEYMKIAIAGPEDISAMKLVAITDRGTKKDFIDLYFLTHKLFTMEDMFEFYDKKYHLFLQNKLTLLKSLQYFEDAERSVMPQMIEKINWKDVKDFFKKEVLRLWRKY